MSDAYLVAARLPDGRKQLYRVGDVPGYEAAQLAVRMQVDRKAVALAQVQPVKARPVIEGDNQGGEAA